MMRTKPSFSTLKRLLTDDEIRVACQRAAAVSRMSRFELALFGLAPLAAFIRRKLQQPFQAQESTMRRSTLAFVVSLGVVSPGGGGMQAFAELIIRDECVSAFLNERLKPEDAAIMQRLWFADTGNGASASGTAEPRRDAADDDRVAAQFVALRGELQLRCPSMTLEFE